MAIPVPCAVVAGGGGAPHERGTPAGPMQVLWEPRLRGRDSCRYSDCMSQTLTVVKKMCTRLSPLYRLSSPQVRAVRLTGRGGSLESIKGSEPEGGGRGVDWRRVCVSIKVSIRRGRVGIKEGLNTSGRGCTVPCLSLMCPGLTGFPPSSVDPGRSLPSWVFPNNYRHLSLVPPVLSTLRTRSSTKPPPGSRGPITQACQKPTCFKPEHSCSTGGRLSPSPRPSRTVPSAGSSLA